MEEEDVEAVGLVPSLAFFVCSGFLIEAISQGMDPEQ
jgi:hypothetical protein